MSGNVMVRDGRLLGYAGTIGTEELKLMAYESGGRKYLAVYQDGSYFGNIQLS
jgi:hypothetical protein